jgi:hypothetical protein
LRGDVFMNRKINGINYIILMGLQLRRPRTCSSSEVLVRRIHLSLSA